MVRILCVGSRIGPKSPLSRDDTKVNCELRVGGNGVSVKSDKGRLHQSITVVDEQIIVCMFIFGNNHKNIRRGT